jgi:hypothetical protein
MGVNMHEVLKHLESSLQAGSPLAYPAAFVRGVLAGEYYLIQAGRLLE